MTVVTKNSTDQANNSPSDALHRHPPAHPFCCWPGSALFGYFLKLAFVVGVWFKLLFNGSDYIAGLHVYRVPVAMNWEVAMIPFVPQFTLIYSSIYLSMLLLPFVLRSKQELHAMAMSLTTVIGFAAVIFLVAPTEPAYGPLPNHYPLDWLHESAKMLALRHNLAPSLHVAMSWLVLRALATKAPPVIALSLYGWAGAIALATLLTHQHHVIDVVTGCLLSELVYRLMYRPRAIQAPTPRPEPAAS